MNIGNIITNATSSLQTNEIVNKQSNKEKQQEYNQRPEVKAKKREYGKKRYQRNKENNERI